VFHLEADVDPAEAIRAAHALGTEVGAALRPDTPFERVEPWIGRVEQVLVMSVHPGFSGQTFLPHVLPKLKQVRKAIESTAPATDISIDGGVTVETAPSAAEAGATFFVCGNSVFAHGDVASNLTALRRAVTEGARGAFR
jgi:ribulose-phosphate 3-epimerase